MKTIIMIGCVCLLGWVPGLAHAGKWSEYVTVFTKDDVVVSYQQQLLKAGWLVQWRVENKSDDWVAPFTKFRTYHCADGNRKTEKEKTLGPYPPGDAREGGIRDVRVCLGSEIQSVEVEIELRPVSDGIQKMWE